MIEKAGTIVMRSAEQGPEILLVYRAPKKDWSFPKGHIDPGETKEQTALRETKEETGLDVRLVAPLPDITYPTSYGEEIVLRMFLAVPQDPSAPTRGELAGDRAEWMPLERALRELSYPNLVAFLKTHSSSLLPPS